MDHCSGKIVHQKFVNRGTDVLSKGPCSQTKLVFGTLSVLILASNTVFNKWQGKQ